MRFIIRTLFCQNGHFSATFFSSKGKRRFLVLRDGRFKTVKSGFMGTSSTAPRSPFPSGEGFLYPCACGFIPERVTNDNAAGRKAPPYGLPPSPEGTASLHPTGHALGYHSFGADNSKSTLRWRDICKQIGPRSGG